MPKDIRESFGFSLIEVLIALVIFGIGILSVFLLFPAAQQNQRVANERVLVSELARDRLARARTVGAERLLNPVYDVARDPSLSLAAFDTLRAAASAYHNYESFVLSREVMKGSENTALQRVTFSVTLPDGRRESFVTFLARQ